jgi:fatty acid desaturase
LVPVLINGCAPATAAHHHLPRQGTPKMLTIAIILIVLWALGLVSGYAMGGLLHLLLVIALVVFALRFFTGRRIA